MFIGKLLLAAFLLWSPQDVANVEAQGWLNPSTLPVGVLGIFTRLAPTSPGIGVSASVTLPKPPQKKRKLHVQSHPIHTQYSTSSPRTVAKNYARSRLSAGQFGCLDRLWIQESHWTVNLYNPRSGAYGIPQAVPGSKMRSAGADWRTNPITQVRWGLGYIKARYGTPCAAWRHSQLYNWY